MKKIALTIGVLGAVFATSSMAIPIKNFDKKIKDTECTPCKFPSSASGTYYIKPFVNDPEGTLRGRAEARWNNVQATTDTRTAFSRVQGYPTVDSNLNRVSILQVLKDNGGGSTPVAMLAVRKSGSKRIVYNEKIKDSNCGDYKDGLLAEAFINNKGYIEVWYNHVNCGKVKATGTHYFKHGAYHTNSGTGSGNVKWESVTSEGPYIK
jgi:hypothetical protein